MAQQGLNNPPDVSQIASQLLTTQPPKNEAVIATAGSGDRASRDDHQHPRLTSTTYATLDGSGQAAVTFTRTFTNKPGLNLTETDAVSSGQPLALRGIAWAQNAQGLYTGVTIQGQRAQMLPTIQPVSGILTSVISGVNSLVAQLTGFNIFGGTAAGATISVIAVARSDVSPA